MISFSVPGFDDLLDSAFVAGTHEEIIIGDSQKPSAILAMGGDARESSELIAGLVKEGLDGFTRLFDSAPAKQLLLVAVDGSFWGGGVMGSTISMMQGGPLDESTTPMLAYITTHEMFHLWNSNFNIAGQEDSDALQWFGEGAAEYYTWRNFAQSRQVEPDTMLSEWGKRYAKYLAARTDMSMSDAGIVKLDNYDLIYSGGMMATAALDLTIRSESKGAKSLDDALRLLQSRYPAGSEDSLRANELPGVIEEATGVDVDAIFDQFIFGNEVLPMDDYFELAGLLLKPAEEAGSDVVSIADVRSDQQIRVWNSFIE